MEEKKGMCRNAWDGLKEAAALVWDRTTSVLLGHGQEDGTSGQEDRASDGKEGAEDKGGDEDTGNGNEKLDGNWETTAMENMGDFSWDHAY